MGRVVTLNERLEGLHILQNNGPNRAQTHRDAPLKELQPKPFASYGVPSGSRLIKNGPQRRFGISKSGACQEEILECENVM